MKQNELKNLKKVINELNSSSLYEYDGEIEVYESQFKFKLEERKEGLVLFDENENYNIDYLEELNCSMYDLSNEFGFEFIPETIDEIHKKLENALKKDLGNEFFLEWQDTVTMLICK